MWPIQFAFRLRISCMIFLCSLTLSNTSWLCQLKIPLSFRLEVHYLNQRRHRVPSILYEDPLLSGANVASISSSRNRYVTSDIGNGNIRIIVLQSKNVSPFILGTPFWRRSQWPCGLRRRSAAARLLRLWVQIPPGHGCLSVVSVVCCEVEVSATSWSLVQRTPTDCDASLCVI